MPSKPITLEVVLKNFDERFELDFSTVPGSIGWMMRSRLKDFITAHFIALLESLRLTKANDIGEAIGLSEGAYTPTEEEIGNEVGYN